MVSLLGIDFGDGACHTRNSHPAEGGAIWLIKQRGSAFSKVNVPAQRVALLHHLLQRFPKSLLRWKGTPPASGELAEMKTRAPQTWTIPARTAGEKIYALVEKGEWLVYGSKRGARIEDDRLDVWDERKGLFVLSPEPDYFIGSRVGDDPWIFWIRPDLDWRLPPA